MVKKRFSSAAERAREAAKVEGPGGGGSTYKLPSDFEIYKPEKGRAKFRILPYVVTDENHPDGPTLAPVGELWYKRPFKRHRNVGPDKELLICPRSIGKPCPICEYHAEAKADPDVDEKQVASAKPQEMVMYNVIEINKKGEEIGDPMFWPFSYALFEKHFKAEINDPENEECASFMDLERSYYLEVRFSEETFAGNKYIEADKINFEEAYDLGEEILDEVVNLDEVLVVKSYEEIEKMFLGESSGGQEEDPEDKPARSGRSERGGRPTRSRSDRPSRTTRKSADDEKEPEDKQARRSTTRRKKSAEKEETPEDKPARPGRSERTSRRKTEEKKTSSGECDSGYEFGKDCDTQKECAACEKWEACAEAFENNP